MAELHALLGLPSRIVEPVTPAPVKHRNNQMHVYDPFGVYFNEHHQTRRIQGCEIVFWPEEYGVPFKPTESFRGLLQIAGYEVPIRPDLLPFLKDCPVAFKPVLGGWFRAERDGHFVIVTAKGERLRSGRRSKSLRLVDMSLSWPHDPWGTPVAT